MDDRKSRLLDEDRMKTAGLWDFEDDEQLQRWLDERGGGELAEQQLRAAVMQVPGSWFPGIVRARAWLDKVDRARADNYSREALDAAKAAAEASAKSAKATEAAAKWAMWTALLSAAVAGAAAISSCLPT